VNQKRGIRWNTTKAYLREASRQPNLTIMTGCQAERLLFDDVNDAARCTGVQFTGGGTLAGAGTAQNRAGSRRDWQSGTAAIIRYRRSGTFAGGGCYAAAYAAGRRKNLQDHLQLRSVYKVQGVPTLNGLTQHWWNKAAIGLEYLLRQSGPMAMAPSQLGLFYPFRCVGSHTGSAVPCAAFITG
jgi:choline dehydrogenase